MSNPSRNSPSEEKKSHGVGSPRMMLLEDLSSEDAVIAVRRERVLLLLAGVFLSSMTMLNVLGVTRFLDFSFTVGTLSIPLKLPIGVLPYPVTFLCTDLISEIYGRARANFVVWSGLIVNLWLFFILWFGGWLPGADSKTPEWRPHLHRCPSGCPRLGRGVDDRLSGGPTL